MKRWISDAEGRAAYDELGRLRAAAFGKRWPSGDAGRVGELRELLRAWRRQGLSISVTRDAARYVAWKLGRTDEPPPRHLAAAIVAGINAGSFQAAEDLLVAAQSQWLTERSAWELIGEFRARASDVLRERPALRRALCRLEFGPPRDLWRPPSADGSPAEADSDTNDASGAAQGAPPAGPRM